MSEPLLKAGNFLHEPKGDAFAATWLLHPDAPKIELSQELRLRLARARKAADIL